MKNFYHVIGLMVFILAGCNPKPETAPIPASTSSDLAPSPIPITPEPPPVAGTAQVEHVTAEQARGLYEQRSNLVVLDVRTPAEYDKGHIPGALNFDFNDPDFAKKIAQLDKSKPYLVHCASGGRSTKSLDAFKAEGFQTIYHLDGGMKAWQTMGNPVAPSPK